MERDDLNGRQRNSTRITGVFLLFAAVLLASQIFAVPQYSGSEQPVNIIVTRLDERYPEDGSPTSLLLSWLEAAYSDHPTVTVRYADTCGDSGIGSLNDFIGNLPTGSFVIIHGDGAVSDVISWELNLDIVINGDHPLRNSPLGINPVQFQHETAASGSDAVPDYIRFIGYATLASVYYQRDEISVAGQACSQALGVSDGVPDRLVSGIEFLRTDILDEVQLANDLYYLTEEIETESEEGELYMERALLNSRLGNYEDCVDDLESAIMFGPSEENSPALFAQSILDIQTETRSAYNEGTQIAPEIFEAVEGHLDDALRYLNSAVELNPDNSELYLIRAHTHGYLLDLTSASEDLSRAIELDPDYHQALAYRGSIRIEMGYPDEAVQDLSSAIELVADSVSYLESRAFAYQMMGDEENAQADLARIAELQ